MALLAGLAFITLSASAQTIAYRQTNLVSDVDSPGFARHLNPFLQDPWGIAFPPGEAFFIASGSNGRVLEEDANGNGGPGAFVVPNPARTGPALTMGIIADPTSLFGAVDPRDPFVTTVIMASADGGIYVWGVDAAGASPTEAILKVDHSQTGAVYTGLAILTPSCCAPFLAVANFHSGELETYTTSFVPLGPPGPFVDPDLPAGFAPFGLQVIGNELYVAFALQDADKRNPVGGSGNGLVSVFSLDGRFLRRLAAGDALDAPWGMTQAGPDFGPFSNDILVAGTGDGAISAFDPATGDFAGLLKDGDGNLLHDAGLHGLFFGSALAGDPKTLYFTAGINNDADGLFGAITAGLVSTTSVSASPAEAGVPMTIGVVVAAGTGNTGTPTGTVIIKDGANTLGTPTLVAGAAAVDATLTGIGIHNIRVLYSGDAAFLASTGQVQVEVAGRATTATLVAPSIAPPASAVKLTATIVSSIGIPSGQVSFLEGNSSLGTAPLDAAGVATIALSGLAGGNHSLTANYLGDGTFLASISSPVSVAIADFSFAADHTSATLAAGQSTQFVLTVGPTTNFPVGVSFSCAATAGITCAFNPATLSPNNGSASTILTVAAAATSQNTGLMAPDHFGPVGLPALCTLLLLWLALTSAQFGVRRTFARAGAPALVLAGIALAGCGGGGSSTTPVNRGAAAVTVTAQAGAVTHTIVLNVRVQ